ncbi:IS66 family insertion sequence element accessory protein TnpA [Acidithiobacillus caldus]|uniref:IS66 family insertion sequence element accessory protein TnpA n=1 Tax=Acidithiobacillus caldus TaxID=33059 RepID=UPI003F73C04A
MTKGEKIAYWRQRVERFRASELSVKKYCAQEGMAVATLDYLRKRFADSIEGPYSMRLKGSCRSLWRRPGLPFCLWRFSCCRAEA